MKTEHAKYEIGANKNVVRYFLTPQDNGILSQQELEVRDCIRKKLLNVLVKSNKPIDPYKAAEKILAEHYGYAKMVEANYDWRPRVRY